MENQATNVLQRHLPRQAWQLRKPRTGWRKTCYVARSGGEQYFLKFDVPVALLKRLGEIGVAPQVLFSGEDDGITYVIQEFVDGIHPQSQQWMRQRVSELASIIGSYHHDEPLLALLSQDRPTRLEPHLVADTQWLSERFQACRNAYLRTAEMQAGFARLLGAASGLQPEPLVPVHNDPSPTNILLVGRRLLFLDWDEITLSDPMRDVGLLLWWNFPPEQWSLFFEKIGLDLNTPRLHKIYWFAARASLDIALWHAERGMDGRGFAEDFLAALNQEPNPKGY